ncbi:unnamed protein product [Effrenium voratum]|uniref:Uncharacterized protein n=1 Tax=Effrenium voratum TaxID=2562239 RepID=A0AA36I3X5_9DINO|nr:unnamed protein product [Effrenium voratum]
MILLDRGCQADAQDALGRTPMHFAVCSKEPKLCRLLLSCPCLVTRCDARGRSALAYAVLNTMPSVRDENVQLLLEYLAEPNAQDFFGLSPLHYAAEAGAQGAVALLLQEAADPSLQEPSSGRTPLDMANGEATRKLLKESARGRLGVASFGNACGYDEDFSMLGALSDANFKEMQCKFIQMMKLVQESGLRQGQHLRRPSLFDGSWMAEIHSHQKLLGKELAAVSGPHTCIRVFNLLHPPSHFPQVSLDDKDISSYYDALWDERDLGSEEKQEDLRAKQQKQAEELLEQKEALRLTKMEIQEGRTRERHLNAELQAALQDASQGAEKEARGEGWPHSLGHRVLRAGRQLAQKGEELRSAEAAAQKLQRKASLLQEELQEARTQSSELQAEQLEAQKKLEKEQLRRGEEKSWKLIAEEDRHQSEVVRELLEERLEESEVAISHARRSAQLTKEECEERLGQAELSHQLRQELGAARAEAACWESSLELAKAEAQEAREAAAVAHHTEMQSATAYREKELHLWREVNEGRDACYLLQEER